jgi:hypothetical protein
VFLAADLVFDEGLMWACGRKIVAGEMKKLSMPDGATFTILWPVKKKISTPVWKWVRETREVGS